MRTLAWLSLVILLAAGFVTYAVLSPYGPRSEMFVDIPPGTSTEKIGALMEGRGVIRSRFGFDVLRVAKGGTLKAGEYRFDHPAPIGEVYGRLVKGDVYTRTLTIPEGFNMFDIAQAAETAGLGSGKTFLAAEREHTELISEWGGNGIVPASSLEGFLFPDTYHFSRQATPLQMLTVIVRRFRQSASALGLGGDVRRTVTMASLIEKEVREDSERPLVAGVFTNRIERGMPLQTDPTVIYAALLDGRYRGTIYSSDLQSSSPYNTYKHAGLPPGPICNPGLASLRAALMPAKTPYVYFVSDAAGRSRFSVNLKEHDQNVVAYRQAERSDRRR